MTCPTFTTGIERKMNATIWKARRLIEDRYDPSGVWKGEWVIKSYEGPESPYRVELHVPAGSPPHVYILADYSAMQVKVFGPFMRHIRTYHASKVRPKTIQDLTADEREKILREANMRCYREIAEDMDIPVGTIRRVVRTHRNSRLKRYMETH
jgi:hypothetical protein